MDISNLFSVSNSIGDSVVAIRVNRGCVVSIFNRETLVDFIEFYMVDSNVVLGMDYLNLCYAL